MHGTKELRNPPRRGYQRRAIIINYQPGFSGSDAEWLMKFSILVDVVLADVIQMTALEKLHLVPARRVITVLTGIRRRISELGY